MTTVDPYYFLAEEVLKEVRGGIKFDVAFSQTYASFGRKFQLDWNTAKSEVGKILARIKKASRKKAKNIALKEAMEDAALHEAELIRDIPEDDL